MEQPISFHREASPERVKPSSLDSIILFGKMKELRMERDLEQKRAARRESMASFASQKQLLKKDDALQREKESEVWLHVDSIQRQRMSTKLIAQEPEFVYSSFASNKAFKPSPLPNLPAYSDSVSAAIRLRRERSMTAQKKNANTNVPTMQAVRSMESIMEDLPGIEMVYHNQGSEPTSTDSLLPTVPQTARARLTTATSTTRPAPLNYGRRLSKAGKLFAMSADGVITNNPVAPKADGTARMVPLTAREPLVIRNERRNRVLGDQNPLRRRIRTGAFV
jgi:hypothetical protein